MTVTTSTAQRLYPQRSRRRSGGETPLRGDALDALPEPMRQAVVDAVAGRDNVRAYLVDGADLPRRGEVVIRNR